MVSCLADLGKLPAQRLLLTVTGRLLSEPQLKQKPSGGSIITIKLDDDSLAENAAFQFVTVSYLHDLDR